MLIPAVIHTFHTSLPPTLYSHLQVLQPHRAALRCICLSHRNFGKPARGGGMAHVRRRYRQYATGKNAPAPPPTNTQVWVGGEGTCEILSVPRSKCAPASPLAPQNPKP